MQLDRYRAVFCDLDGCLVSAETVLPGAAELLTVAGERLCILSNNSTDTPTTLSARLNNLGLDIDAGRIVLAGTSTVDHIAASAPGATIAIYGSPEIKAYAVVRGLVLAEANPDVVLLTRDVDITYSALNALVRQLETGARFVVSNIDATHPGPDGHAVVETGALLKAVTACLPGIAFEAIGKPSAAIYQAALKQVDAEGGEILAIGDNPETDGRGAARVGIDCVIIGNALAADFPDLPSFLQAVASPIVRSMGRAGG